MPRNVQCKRCYHFKNEWCIPIVDSPDPDIVRDCQYFKQKTNADRFRNMSDEELAAQIAEWNFGDCPSIELCPDHRNENTHYSACTPWKCWLDWLKEEGE